MGGRGRAWRVLWAVPVVLVERSLDLLGERQSGPVAEHLLHAVLGRVTAGGVSSFVLAVQQIVFLLLFLLLYGDCVAGQQRTGAVYLFSRMKARGPWFRRAAARLGLYATLYCGLFLLTHTGISLFISTQKDWAGLPATLLELWALLSLVTWLLALGCNLLCGVLGTAAGVSVGMLLCFCLAALSVQVSAPNWVQICNPLSFREEVFAGARAFGGKCLAQIGALFLVSVCSGLYFCRKDLFAAEGEG